MKYLKSKVHAEISLLALSLIFFFDDYFNALTVGSVMQKITDRFKISRVKLGMLTNSLAAPTVVLLPMSSWVAEIIMQLRNAGVTDKPVLDLIVKVDPFYIYVNVIPFLFYSMIIVLSTWYLVGRRISFGIVKKHEEISDRTGNLFGGKVALESVKTTRNDISAEYEEGRMIDFVFPISLLFFSTLGAILYFGNF